MSAAETTTSGSIDAEVTVAYLKYIGGCTAARTVGTAMPAPAVVGDDTSATCAEGIVFSVAFSEGRGVVNIRSAYLRRNCFNTEAQRNRD